MLLVASTVSCVPTDDLPLSRSAVDRDGAARSRDGLIAELMASESTLVAHVVGSEVLIGDGPQLVLTPAGDAIGEDDVVVYLGADAEHAYLAQVHPEVHDGEVRTLRHDLARVADDPQGASATTTGAASPRPAAGRHTASLRQVGWQLPARDAGLAAAAIALAQWHQRNPFCPRCGGPTDAIDAGWVRRCRNDESLHFPRTDPAVIMSIVDADDRLLLGHAATWPEGRYSIPAGFVEPGESIEAAVRREVREETNVRVGEVHYRASQPWPFPASLMIGCTGAAVSTDVVPDGNEITAAMFVTRDELTAAVRTGRVQLPSPTSIAHHLIAQWFGGPLPSRDDACPEPDRPLTPRSG